MFELGVLVSGEVIEKERIKQLNDASLMNGSFVTYWMQQSQRTRFNHALQFAIDQANKLKLPLIVYFGLTDQYPDANRRHYQFMLEGLKKVQIELEKLHITFVLKNQDPSKGIISLSKESKMVIVDRGYTRIQRTWRKDVADSIDCPLIQVESDVIIPVETASIKEEYGAYTIRPKINKKLDQFLQPVSSLKPNFSSLSFDFKSISLKDINEVLDGLSTDTSVEPSPLFSGGIDQAQKHLDRFLSDRISHFSTVRNDPSKQVCSNLSPYLHFGQISPVDIALQILNAKKNGSTDFLEELIVRRELAMNFVFYNEQYDTLRGLPDWAYSTLKNHENDRREYNYSKEELEKAKTHDRYWNAAQKEMILAGKMHGYLRMYWGKKILEWTETPKKAYEIALYLNNKYELDGRDPNGYAGVAWCFGKHDRAWANRPIFGKVRYMSKKGLERKGDIDAYVQYVSSVK